MAQVVEKQQNPDKMVMGGKGGHRHSDFPFRILALFVVLALGF